MVLKIMFPLQYISTLNMNLIAVCIFVFPGTLEGLKKFLDTDGVYGKAAPDHDEL